MPTLETSLELVMLVGEVKLGVTDSTAALAIEVIPGTLVDFLFLRHDDGLGDEVLRE